MGMRVPSKDLFNDSRQPWRVLMSVDSERAATGATALQSVQPGISRETLGLSCAVPRCARRLDEEAFMTDALSTLIFTP